MKCGHSEPSSEETSWLAKSPIAFKYFIFNIYSKIKLFTSYYFLKVNFLIRNEYIVDLKEVDTAFIEINSQTKVKNCFIIDKFKND